jgi:hypothetical protein
MSQFPPEYRPYVPATLMTLVVVIGLAIILGEMFG